MTQAQAQALARMQARNAALTPEERKARSAKAAAASAARTAQRKAAAAAGNADGGEKATSTTKARVAPEQTYAFRVLLLTDAGSKWADVQAGGMQRACRLARKANPGAMVRGVFRADCALPGR